MKFLIILYAKYNDGTADKKSMYEAVTEREAVASFHGYMSSYMNNPIVSHAMCMVLDAEGGIYKSEVFDADEEE